MVWCSLACGEWCPPRRDHCHNVLVRCNAPRDGHPRDGEWLWSYDPRDDALKLWSLWLWYGLVKRLSWCALSSWCSSWTCSTYGSPPSCLSCSSACVSSHHPFWSWRAYQMGLPEHPAPHSPEPQVLQASTLLKILPLASCAHSSSTSNRPSFYMLRFITRLNSMFVFTMDNDLSLCVLHLTTPWTPLHHALFNLF